MNNVIEHLSPNHPTFALVDRRLATYKDWPPGMPIKPEVLAKAGFYYLGRGDFVQCYYCGAGLKKWDAQDSPWEEHAKWFPNCGHLLLIKGKEYVDKVQQTLKNNSQPVPKHVEITLDEQIIQVQCMPPIVVNQNGLLNLENIPSQSGTKISLVSNSDLIKENEKLKEDKLCLICYENKADIVFIPCGHLSTCGFCTSNLKICCVCRTDIKQCIKVFNA